MTSPQKTPDSLTLFDLEKYPAWQFSNDDQAGELLIEPITNFPISNPLGVLFGVLLRLRNDRKIWGILSNLNFENPELNKHFLSLSVEQAGKWFHVARYHDFDYAERGPEALANLLKMSTEDIFPISYDITKLGKGKPECLERDEI